MLVVTEITVLNAGHLQSIVLCAGEKDADGVYTNTEDIDCEVCKGDLHLWAVVSPTYPERATCPEHVSALECPTEAMRLLYRCPLKHRSRST